MNRREFFRRSSLIAAGVIAADQLELTKAIYREAIPGFDSYPLRSGLFA